MTTLEILPKSYPAHQDTLVCLTPLCFLDAPEDLWILGVLYHPGFQAHLEVQQAPQQAQESDESHLERRLT